MRIWPLLASASIVVLVALFMLGMSDPFELLGAPTAVSVGVMLATLAFAFFAVAGVFSSFKTRRTPMNRFAWWHSTAGSVLHFVVAAYLALFGIIGLMTWA